MIDNSPTSLGSPKETPSSPKDEKEDRGRKYLAMVKEREQEFSSGWWVGAKESNRLYGMPVKDSTLSVGDKKDQAYNILYSNTEVLLPSLYSATPKPDVRARFKDTDLKPIPECIERFLTVFSDGASPGFESLDNAGETAVLAALTDAMGCIRIRLYPEMDFPIQPESVPYKNLLWGKTKKWSNAPWVAFKHELTKEEFGAQFKIPSEKLNASYAPTTDTQGNPCKDCVVYEFWHKASKTVWFLSEEWDEVVVSQTDDPLGLAGFYPTPGPLMLTKKSDDLQPIALYEYYRNQAEELNRVTVRLNRVLSAIRVRGVYNSLLGDDMQKLLAAGEMENELIAASDAGMLAQSGGFDKQIWLLPIEKLILVAQQLYQNREAVKQVIYELTGISDIIRGSNVASETATASNLKNKWGSIRLRKMQTIVANYMRDLFRIVIDAGSQEVSPQVWQKVIQLPIPTQVEKEAAEQEMAAWQQTQAGMPPPQPPQPGQQPPPPPQPDPALVQKLQSPSMEEVLAQIASDVNRTFTINIQTDSTVDLDTAQDKNEVTEFMNALGQMLAGLQPLASLGDTGLEAAKAILIAVCQRFKFGIPIAGVIAKITAPPPLPAEAPTGPPPPTPEETQAIKAEAEAKIQKVQMDMELNTLKLELEKQKLQFEREKMEMEKQKMQLDFQQAVEKARLAAITPVAKAPNASV